MRDWETEFIRRWEAGETTDQIAAALSIAEGTAKSRANTLQREGKITPRSRGGRRARSREPRHDHTPDDQHEHPHVAPPSVDDGHRTRVPDNLGSSATAPSGLDTLPRELLDLLQAQHALLTHLSAAVEGLKAEGHPPRIRTRVPAPEPPTPHAELREPWTLRIRPSIRVAVEQHAAALGCPHNHVIEAALLAYLQTFDQEVVPNEPPP